jgi:hypothetical protein
MRWFFDCEFDEDGHTIDLISIALVSESGVAYTACLADGWSADHCNEWVKANVLPKLPPPSERKTRLQVRDEIRDLVGDAPEFWAYYADYDWVALCQLFGRMVDLPKGWPMFCRDLIQTIKAGIIPKESLPKQDARSEHDALADAQWNREVWLYLAAEGGL